MTMTIGKLAHLAGTTVRSVRYYHTHGLMETPCRQPNGYRLYRAADLTRLSRIRLFRNLGIPVAEIAELLDGNVTDTRNALDRLDAELADKFAEIATQRTYIESLRCNIDPELPDAFADILSRYLAAGAPEDWVNQERSFLILAITVAGGDEEVRDALLSVHHRVLAEPNRNRAMDLLTRLHGLDEALVDDNQIETLVVDFCDFTEEVLPEQVAPETDSPLGRVDNLVSLLREHQSDRRTTAQKRFANAVAAEFSARRSQT